MGCGCGACGNETSKVYKAKYDLIFLFIISFALLLGIILESRLQSLNIELPYYLFFYLLIALPVIKKAFQGLLSGGWLDENFLMSIATFGAFATNQLPEALGVMLFYRWGSFFEQLGERRSQQSIERLMELRPEVVSIKSEGQWIEIALDQAKIGDCYLLKAGERNGLDGIITSGSASVDTAALTGESINRQLKEGEALLAGMIVTSGVLEVTATALAKDSSLERIMQLTREAISQKSSPERFVKRFARIYTPIVVALCLIIAFIPPLILQQPFSFWVTRALTLLVISCPCALVVSVPLAYFAGMGLASKHGLLFKGSHYLDYFNQVNQVIFDKTGTLTKGSFEINNIETTIDKPLFLTLAKAAEYYSNHPIAQSVKNYTTDINLNKDDISNYTELSGLGISTQYQGKQLLAGNQALLRQFSITYPPLQHEGTELLLAYNGQYVGCLTISDAIKESSAATIKALLKKDIVPIMLSGDHQETVKNVCNHLAIEQYYAELLPEQKLLKLKELMASHQGKTLFVGDGINDGPSIAFADIGLAMGSGSDSALETADVVLLNNDPLSIIKGMEISASTAKTVRQNILFPILIKVVFIILGTLGLASMWAAVFADTGVLILAILNSLKLFTKKVAI